ncbi:type IV secretory system conjugative DNA transfer family protein [Tunturiibacter psychrotolerans]|uniref:type IV secretory system conjugative DNA transfer family protein n=1 Tax=Tunturiibacter psychrotolerans TaxID=3069686 RepID=UPI003D1A7C44
MSPSYDQPRRYQAGPEDLAGILVLFGCAVIAFCWYVAVSRMHLRNEQCLEIFMNCAILFFGGGFVVAQVVGKRRKREENWPHPPAFVAGTRDASIARDANQNAATLLGYNVHKEPWLWPDAVRMKHGVIVGGTGAGKSTFLENVIAQDLARRFGNRKMPMIIFDGKGEREFLDRLLPHIEAAGRLQDLRVLDPTHPTESSRYNPFYALDDAYQEHVNFIFRSFGLREDFFKGHQEAYLSDLVRVLQYTGKLFNVYDVLVMALDENVLQEQIELAKERLSTLAGISMQKRLNFEMSVRMLQRSLSDRERVEKIQGLLNELLSFLEDELSIVTGSYQDLLTLDDVFEKDLILFVSLNTNRNQRAVEALGKILLQNIQLMVGKRYAQSAGDRDADEPMLSVILDEFAPFAYPGFTQVLQTARGARVSFLFSFQSLPQLQRVSQAFSDEVSSAPGTKMLMNVSEENTAQWFLKASAKIATKRRNLAVRRTGIFSAKYTETGTGSESEMKETRAREEHIKNLPVGQMEILMVDSREGTRHSHLHVRRTPSFRLEGLSPRLYPKMHSYLDAEIGVNLRFKEAENRKQRRRRTAGVSLDTLPGA